MGARKKCQSAAESKGAGGIASGTQQRNTYLPGRDRWVIRNVHGSRSVTSIALRRGAGLRSPQEGEPAS
uniref:Uncharacterized protein n=1 Tax=Salix viminalis TaxID=40686 RepID=A0A6N2LX83_SALVM